MREDEVDERLLMNRKNKEGRMVGGKAGEGGKRLDYEGGRRPGETEETP